MDEERYKALMKTDKFETICFSKDYIDKLLEIEKVVSIEDYGEIMGRLYDEAFKNGQRDVLIRYSSFSNYELDLLDESL